MSNFKWLGGLLSLGKSSSSSNGDCFSCANGLDCPEHGTAATKTPVNVANATPGLRKMAKDIETARQVLSNESKVNEAAKAELLRKQAIIALQEEMFEESAKLIDKIAETRVSTEQKIEVIKSRNAEVRANDTALAGWANTSLEQRIAEARARLTKETPTVGKKAPEAKKSVPTPTPTPAPKVAPKGVTINEATAALLDGIPGLKPETALGICKLDSNQAVKDQVQKWLDDSKYPGVVAIANILVNLGYRTSLWKPYVNLSAPTPAPAAEVESDKTAPTRETGNVAPSRGDRPAAPSERLFIQLPKGGDLPLDEDDQVPFSRQAALEATQGQ